MKVNVFRKDASTAIKQEEKPEYSGKLLEFSQYQRNYGDELVPMAIVQDDEGYLEAVPLRRIQVVVVAAKPAAKAQVTSSKK